MNEIKYRGVYGYFVDNLLVYIGSSACSLEKLDYNHRHWKEQYGDQGRTRFRWHLTENDSYKPGMFKWLVKPAPRNQHDVEELEGQLIRSLNPYLNVDKNPVASSIKYGRY